MLKRLLDQWVLLYFVLSKVIRNIFCRKTRESICRLVTLLEEVGRTSKKFELTSLTFSETLAKKVPSLPSLYCSSSSPSASLIPSCSRSLSFSHSESSRSSESSKQSQSLQKQHEIEVSLLLESSHPSKMSATG